MWTFSGETAGKSLINGAWQAAWNAKTFPVRNPATDEIIGQAPAMGAVEAQDAIAAAAEALPAWRALPGKERAVVLKQWAQLLRDNAEELAELLTAEQGKPILESIGEIIVSADYIEWAAEQGKRPASEIAEASTQDSTVFITREPVGVVAAITPWNFPAAMVARKLGPALAAGCTAVLKPSEETPLIALAMAALALEAGVPPGAFSVITGDRAAAGAIGRALMESPQVRKISFTGSTAVGKALIAQSALGVKRLSLELGGNAPFIVLDSADIDMAVQGALSAKFMNAGQMCVAPNRIYVHEKLYDGFAEKLTEAVRALQTGNGAEPVTQVGPLINRAAVEKVQSHVDDALAGGATLLCGGRGTNDGPNFYAPTVLKNMKPGMLIAREETFGPVAALFRFRDEDDAVAQANNTSAGLAAYVFGEDAGQCRRVAARIEAGMVGINDPMMIDETIPFGGVKESGYGRENGRQGIEEYQEIKATVIKNPKLKP